MKAILFNLVAFYQKFVSIILPRSCRYYPTCSEYAIWQLRHNNLLSAVVAILLRILKCNQLFRGGIDYPIVKKNFSPLTIFEAGVKLRFERIKFIFVPYKKDKFYVIKVLKET